MDNMYSDMVYNPILGSFYENRVMYIFNITYLVKINVDDK